MLVVRKTSYFRMGTFDMQASYHVVSVFITWSPRFKGISTRTSEGKSKTGRHTPTRKLNPNGKLHHRLINIPIWEVLLTITQMRRQKLPEPAGTSHSGTQTVRVAIASEVWALLLSVIIIFIEDFWKSGKEISI